MSRSALLSLHFNKRLNKNLFFKIGLSYLSRLEFYYDYKIGVSYYLNGSTTPTYNVNQYYTTNSYRLSRTNFVYLDLGLSYKFGKK